LGLDLVFYIRGGKKNSKGKAIGPLDIILAAHALSLDVMLALSIIKEFSKILNLKCEN